jgi:putative aminopeptidase FrvX
LAGRLMRQPAAPFFEDAVRAEVEAFSLEHGLDCARDAHGNLFVSYNTAPRTRPLALAAHLDHPGFEILRRLGPRRLVAQFNGGVPDDYFRPGVRVRLHPGATPARLGRRRPGKAKRFEILCDSAPAETPCFGVWELPEFAVRRGQIHGRACDDHIGAAAVLATLLELKSRRARANVIGVFSRAEEVGFHGALTIAAARRLPADALVLSLETSKELAPVQMGAGVILRVGDKASVFDSAATRFLHEVALGLAKRRPDFQFQRALMSGGTCEATAYQEFGYTVGAVCVALGNYHNCGPRRHIAAEFVSVRDACAMVELLVQAARQMPAFETLTGRLPRRLQGLLRQAQKRLKGRV